MHETDQPLVYILTNLNQDNHTTAYYKYKLQKGVKGGE